ncbi:Spherulin-2A [Eumeta japonica]|uniref:Spherulin-2A n=1 Tax=Eumeta variegata TaxID=151549 RepID=A0A4C1UCW3_EUMVA|nr:Spherulin-2A [Eumeta japonica]
MKFNLLLLSVVLPAYVHGNIHIDIQASKHSNESFVHFVGVDVALISAEEERTFQVYPQNLKKAVEIHFGKWPSDVFLRGPTPWNLYSSYGWNEVQRVLVPTAARIINITTEPVIISNQKLYNNGTTNGTFNAGMTQSIETTATTTWITGGELNVGAEISVGISFAGAKVSAATKMSYTTQWGKNTERSKAITVGTTSGVEVELMPGQVAYAELTATRGTMEVEVDYTAWLDGIVAVNYPDKYKDHHFWAFNVKNLQKAVGAPQTIQSKAVLVIATRLNAVHATMDNERQRKREERVSHSSQIREGMRDSASTLPVTVFIPTTFHHTKSATSSSSRAVTLDVQRKCTERSKYITLSYDPIMVTARCIRVELEQRILEMAKAVTRPKASGNARED